MSLSQNPHYKALQKAAWAECPPPECKGFLEMLDRHRDAPLLPEDAAAIEAATTAHAVWKILWEKGLNMTEKAFENLQGECAEEAEAVWDCDGEFTGHALLAYAIRRYRKLIGLPPLVEDLKIVWDDLSQRLEKLAEQTRYEPRYTGDLRTDAQEMLKIMEPQLTPQLTAALDGCWRELEAWRAQLAATPLLLRQKICDALDYGLHELRDALDFYLDLWEHLGEDLRRTVPTLDRYIETFPFVNSFLQKKGDFYLEQGDLENAEDVFLQVFASEKKLADKAKATTDPVPGGTGYYYALMHLVSRCLHVVDIRCINAWGDLRDMGIDHGTIYETPLAPELLPFLNHAERYVEIMTRIAADQREKMPLSVRWTLRASIADARGKLAKRRNEPDVVVQRYEAEHKLLVAKRDAARTKERAAQKKAHEKLMAGFKKRSPTVMS